MTEGYVVVSMVKGEIQAQGESFGIVISVVIGQRKDSWFVLKFVIQLLKGHYHGEYDRLAFLKFPV